MIKDGIYPKPCHENLFVKPNHGINQSETIKMIRGSEEKPDHGTVVAVGEGKIHSVELVDGKLVALRLPMSANVGDTVYYSKHAGYKHTFGEGDKNRDPLELEKNYVLVLKDSDLMGVSSAAL